jgi:TM2 domain-containing membrane protein YozV
MPLIITSSQNSQSVLEPWLAVNLSMFFPGIGQLYAGKKSRGWGFICCQAALMAIAFWSIFSSNGNTVIGLACLCIAFILYIFGLFDAYNCVIEQLDIQDYEKIPRINKDPWFAVFLTRILPGLGHLYIRPLAKVPSSMRKLGESEGMYELPTGKKPEARGFQTLEWSTSRDFYSNAGGSALAYSPEKENWQTTKTQLGRPIIDDIGVLERVPYLFSYWSVMGSK